MYESKYFSSDGESQDILGHEQGLLTMIALSSYCYSNLREVKYVLKIYVYCLKN